MASRGVTHAYGCEGRVATENLCVRRPQQKPPTAGPRMHHRSPSTMQPDTLHRFVFERLGVRGELVCLDAAFQAVLGATPTPGRSSGPSARRLVSVLLLTATLKFQGSLTLQAQGSGPIRTLVVQGTHQGTVRGLARIGRARSRTATCSAVRRRSPGADPGARRRASATRASCRWRAPASAPRSSTTSAIPSSCRPGYGSRWTAPAPSA
jgi:hypothetical protein